MTIKIDAFIIDTYESNFFSHYAIQKITEIKHVSTINTFSTKPIYKGETFHKIKPIRSILEYSKFIVEQIPEYLESDFALIFQWDGFSVNPSLWSDEFAQYDYIGAKWDNPPREYCVGNGGFSLRSKKFVSAGKRIKIDWSENTAEDEALCRVHRKTLEKHGIRFATECVADKFSFESNFINNTFGFHGSYNLPFLFKEDVLIENIDELILRTSHPFFYAKLISNSMQNKMEKFASTLIERVRNDELLFAKVRRYFRN